MDGKKVKRIRVPEIEWVGANRARLDNAYAGEYVAIAGSSMVAHGPDPLGVHEEASAKGHADALIHRVLPREYQGMKFVR